MYVFQGQNADWPQISYLIFTVPDLQWVQNFKELRQTKNLCLLNFREVGLLDPTTLYLSCENLNIRPRLPLKQFLMSVKK